MPVEPDMSFPRVIPFQKVLKDLNFVTSLSFYLTLLSISCISSVSFFPPITGLPEQHPAFKSHMFKRFIHWYELSIYSLFS